MIYDKIDKLIYINLDKRTDRRELIEKEIEKLNFPKEKIERFSAIDHTSYKTRGERGAGCSLSHLSIYNKMISENLDTILIIEDDFQLSVTSEQFQDILEILFSKFSEFSVCNIGYSEIYMPGEEKTHLDIGFGFRKSGGVHTTSAYIIRKKIIPYIFPLIKLGAINLMNKGNYHINAIDQVWKHVQEIDPNWILAPKCGIQRGSYSDIEQINAEYGV